VLDPFVSLDATEQAELVRRGDVHPLELIDAAIARIERLNPMLNAVITPLFDQARVQATSASLPAGPFRGVPLLLKDFLCHTAGDPYYEGMRFLRDLDWREASDTYLAAKLRAAGFIFLGKTNLPELAAQATTDSAAFGPTRNPWDLSRSPGGSSGGSAAAVAAGLTPLAHANDGFGSIRIPASACGVVGLKPSRGRVSPGPARGAGLLGNIVEHVLTRSVRDTAALLDLLAGPMPGDLFVAPPPRRPYLDEVGTHPGQLRVGLLVQDLILEQPVSRDCVTAVEATGHLLESLGHLVEESFPPALTGATGLGAALGIISASGLAARLDAWSERTGRTIGPQDVEPQNWARAEQGRTFSAVQVHAALQRLIAGVMRVPEWWAAGFDLLVTPTMQQPPPTIAGLTPEQQGPVFGLFAMPYSVTGQPAISLPLHWNTENLPIGIQLVADYGREDLLIQVAAQLEQAQPWAATWSRKIQTLFTTSPDPLSTIDDRR
jgi:amidase